MQTNTAAKELRVGDMVAPAEDANEPLWTGKIGRVVGVGLGHPADPFVAVKFKGERKPVAFYPRHLLLQTSISSIGLPAQAPAKNTGRLHSTGEPVSKAEPRDPRSATEVALQRQVDGLVKLATIQHETILGHHEAFRKVAGLLARTAQAALAIVEISGIREVMTTSRGLVDVRSDLLEVYTAALEASTDAFVDQNKAPQSDETDVEADQDRRGYG